MAVTFSGKDKLLRYARLYVDGYDLSGDALSFSSLDNNEEEVPLTAWSDPTEYFTITGRKVMGISGLMVFMNPDTGRAFDQLKNTPLQRFLSFGFGGAGAPEIGDPAYLMPGLTLSDAISVDNNRVMLSVDGVRLDSARFDAYAGYPLGYVLNEASQKSDTWNGGSIDFAAAQVTPNVGSQAILHVLEASVTTWTFKVQHSTDDSGWADLLTFTANGSAITAERQSAATLVNRFVRFQGTRVGGAGTTTVVCTFARAHRA